MPLPVLRFESCLAACVVACLVVVPGLLSAQAVPRGSLPNPILFVTQVPVPGDFAAIGSVFANHQGNLQSVARGVGEVQVLGNPQ